MTREKFTQPTIQKIAYHTNMLQQPQLSKNLRAFHTRQLHKLNAVLAQLQVQSQSMGLDQQPLMETQRGFLQLANVNCSHCQGTGCDIGRRGTMRHCKCVYRNVFNAVLRKIKYISEFGPGRVVMFQRSNGPFAELPNCDFTIDFYLCFRRSTTRHIQKALFYLHSIQGLDWRGCIQVLPTYWSRVHPALPLPALNRGIFFHCVYAYQEAIGRELVAQKLFPFSEYFTSKRQPQKEISRAKDINISRDPWLNGGYYRDSVNL